MSIGKIEVKTRLWVSLLLAFVVTGAWWIWNGSNRPMVTIKEEPANPSVRLARAGDNGAGEVFRERAEYFDPTPLFFPTEWNYGQTALRESMKRQPGDIFGSFEPNIIYGEQNIKLYSDKPPVMPGILAEVVASGNETPFAGIGEIEIKPVPLAERSGFLEIRNLSSDKPIIAQALTGVVMPQRDFAPLEFFVVVNSGGIVAEPVLVSGSGWDEVDTFLRTYLAKTFRVGERLSPGVYRILIGP